MTYQVFNGARDDRPQIKTIRGKSAIHAIRAAGYATMFPRRYTSGTGKYYYALLYDGKKENLPCVWCEPM